MVPVTLIIILEIVRRVIIKINGEPTGPDDKLEFIDLFLNTLDTVRPKIPT